MIDTYGTIKDKSNDMDNCLKFNEGLTPGPVFTDWCKQPLFFTALGNNGLVILVISLTFFDTVNNVSKIHTYIHTCKCRLNVSSDLNLYKSCILRVFSQSDSRHACLINGYGEFARWSRVIMRDVCEWLASDSQGSWVGTASKDNPLHANARSLKASQHLYCICSMMIYFYWC